MENLNSIRFLVALSSSETRRQVADFIRTQFKDLAVYEAQNGHDALLKFEADPADLLILDTELTGRSYQQVIESVQERLKAHKHQIILLTSIPLPQPLQELVKAQVLQVIPAGPIKERLTASIGQAIDRLNRSHPNEMRAFLLKAGEVLCKEGDPATHVYIVKKGRLRVTVGVGEKAIHVGDVSAGEFVGEMAYFNDSLRSATVVAEEDTDLIEVQLATFGQIIHKKPSVMAAILKTFAKRIQVLNRNRT